MANLRTNALIVELLENRCLLNAHMAALPLLEPNLSGQQHGGDNARSTERRPWFAARDAGGPELPQQTGSHRTSPSATNNPAPEQSQSQYRTYDPGSQQVISQSATEVGPEEPQQTAPEQASPSAMNHPAAEQSQSQPTAYTGSGQPSSNHDTTEPVTNSRPDTGAISGKMAQMRRGTAQTIKMFRRALGQGDGITSFPPPKTLQPHHQPLPIRRPRTLDLLAPRLRANRRPCRIRQLLQLLP